MEIWALMSSPTGYSALEACKKKISKKAQDWVLVLRASWVWCPFSLFSPSLCFFLLCLYFSPLSPTYRLVSATLLILILLIPIFFTLNAGQLSSRVQNRKLYRTRHNFYCITKLSFYCIYTHTINTQGCWCGLASDRLLVFNTWGHIHSRKLNLLLYSWFSLGGGVFASKK